MTGCRKNGKTHKKELSYLPNMQGQADIIMEDLSLLERLVLPEKKILKINDEL